MDAQSTYELVVNTRLAGQSKRFEEFIEFLKSDHPFNVVLNNAEQLNVLSGLTNGKGQIKIDLGDSSKIIGFETASRAILDIGKNSASVTSQITALRAEFNALSRDMERFSNIGQKLEVLKHINPSLPVGSAPAVRRDNRQAQDEAAARQTLNELVRDFRSNSATLDQNRGLVELVRRSSDSRSSIGRFYSGAVTRLDDSEQRRLQALDRAKEEIERNPVDFLLAKQFGTLDLLESVRNKAASRQGLVAGSLGNFAPSGFNPGRLLNTNSLTQLAFAGLSGGGLGSIAAGAVGGGFLGAPGILLGQAVTGAIGQAGAELARVFHEISQAGLVYERSILGISSTLQANTRVIGPNGATVSLKDQLAFQEAAATEIQLKSRSKLLQLGIAGNQEATLVQGLTTALANRGIIANADEVSTLAERLGAVTLSQRPQLLDNPTLYLRDIQDVFSGGPLAKRTLLSQIIRPALAGIENATSGADLIRATDVLSQYPTAIKESSNPAAVFQKLSGAEDQLRTLQGDSFNRSRVDGIKAMADALADPSVQAGARQISSLAGILAGAADKITAESIKAAGFFAQPFTGSADLISNLFSKQEQTGLHAEVDPRVQLTSILNAANVDQDHLFAFQDSARQSPSARLRAFEQITAKIGGTDEYRDKSISLLNLRADELSKLTDVNKSFAGFGAGTFSSQIGLPGHLSEVDVRSQIVQNLQNALSAASTPEARQKEVERLNSSITDLSGYLKELQQNPNQNRDAIDRVNKVISARGNDLAQLQQSTGQSPAQLQLTNQLDQAQTNLFGSKAKVIQDLQAQYQGAVSLAQLKQSIVAGLGPSGQYQQASAQLDSLASQKRAAQAFIDGMVLQLKGVSPELQSVLEEQIERSRLQIKGFEAQETVTRANQKIASTDVQLSSINQNTFAGRRAAIPLEQQKQVTAGLVTPEVAQQRIESQTSDVASKEFQVKLDLVRASEQLKDVQLEEINRRKELNVAITQNIKSLEEFDRGRRLREFGAKGERLALGEQILAAGGSEFDVAPDVLNLIKNPAARKQFELNALLEKQRELTKKQGLFETIESENATRTGLDVNLNRNQQNLANLPRGSRDAQIALYQQALAAQNQFGENAPPIVQRLGDQAKAYFTNGRGPEDFMKVAPFDSSRLPESLSQAAGSTTRDAQRVNENVQKQQSADLKKGLEDIANLLKNQGGSKGFNQLTKQDIGEAMYAAVKTALSGEL